MRSSKPWHANSATAVWHEENRRDSDANRIVDSADIIAERTTKGTALHIVRKGGGAPGEPATGMVFKGEWTDTAYTKGDVVIVRGGISAGTYIAAKDVPAGRGVPTDPPTDPSQGIYWISIGKGDTLGMWT